MTTQEALRQARISSGGLEQAKELHRDARGIPFIESLFHDLAHRRLRQSPGFTGLIALFLAVLGVYGVVASSIAQRTRDFDIRIAMGAQKIDIFRVVARSALKPASIGLALGVTISFGLARLLRVLLYGLDPASLPLFAAVFVFVLVVALFACWLPARHTLKMDPMAALRHE